MACKTGRRVPNVISRSPEGFKKHFETSLMHAPARKAAGADGIFSEALRISPLPSDLLSSLCEAVERIATIPRQWRQVILHPLHKKGNCCDHGKYRPIALLSHATKIIEGALLQDLSQWVQLIELQCGNRAHHSTTTALLRYQYFTRSSMHYVAVLDLQAAYPNHSERQDPGIAADQNT